MHESYFDAKFSNGLVAAPRLSPWARELSRSRCVLSIFLLAAIALSAGCFESKVVTSKVNPKDKEVDVERPTEMNGVFYALPRTVVKAEVPVVKVDNEPGEFVKFIDCFYPDLVPGDDYIDKKSTDFKVAADKIRFDTLFIPDNEEIYLIKTRGGMFETRNLEMELTESGVLVKASAEVTNEAIDIVTGGIKMGVGLLAKASSAGMFFEGGFEAFKKDLPFEQRKCWNKYEGQLERAKIDAEARIAAASMPSPTPSPTPGRRATSMPKPTPPTTPDENARKRKLEEEMDPTVLRTASDFIKAQEAFKLISDLEEQRRKIIVPTDGPPESLKIALEELDKAIENYKEVFFFGTSTPLTWNPSFRLNPDKPSNTSVPLFIFSKTHGVCDVLVKDSQGVQPDPRFKLDGCKGDIIKLEVVEGEDGEGGPKPGSEQFADIVRKAGLRRNGDRGFYYRIPGRAIAFVRKEGSNPKELGRAPLSIAQFGEVVSLPASTGGRKTKYTLALYESSGGLKNFVMGSSALVQQKNLDDLTDATSTAIEAKGERKKAKAPSDELQQLERQRKILEEKKKIRDLEKELDAGSPNDGSIP